MPFIFMNGFCVKCALVESEMGCLADFQPSVDQRQTVHQKLYADKLQSDHLWGSLHSLKKPRESCVSARDTRGQIPDRSIVTDRPNSLGMRARIGQLRGGVNPPQSLVSARNCHLDRAKDRLCGNG
jgi:hypothetical protein